MNSQITKKDNILEFGHHEINSSRGPLACRVFMEDGVSTDLIIRFTDKEFSSDIEDYHPSDDLTFIDSLNGFLTSCGYTGHPVGRAEMGMQGVSHAVIEGGQEFTSWCESLGWKEVDYVEKRRAP